MSGQRRGGEADAPAGYCTLGEAAALYVERLRFSRTKAEQRIVRDITEGTLPAWVLPRFEKFVSEPDYTFDFAASEAVRPARHLTLTDISNGGINLSQGLERRRLVIDDDDIERLIRELAPPQMPAISAMPPQIAAPAAAIAEKRKGGRPPEFDWDGVFLQLRRRNFSLRIAKKSCGACPRGFVAPRRGPSRTAHY